MRFFCTLLLASCTAPLFAQNIKLEGLPLQLDWVDVNGDGRVDLVALMLKTTTDGNMTTWYEDNALRGLYQDETQKEKILVTVLNNPDGWQERHVLNFGVEPVLGFSARGVTGDLYLWRDRALFQYRWENGGWDPKKKVDVPGILGAGGGSMKAFPFLQYGAQQEPWWIVPDIDGLHMVPLNDAINTVHVPYPEDLLDSETDDGVHRLELTVPSFWPVNREPAPELVFQGPEHIIAHRLGAPKADYGSDRSGTLVDINGDGMVDLVETDDVDVDRMKDLATVQTTMRTYLARGPLDFAATPDLEQSVPGFLIEENDSDIKLAEPFLDINGDGKADIVGIAVKLNMFKVLSAVATGRLRIKFLLHLCVQEEDGRFRPLAGGPFPLIWKLNIRRLRMPELAQIAADFDGDGWVDILLDKDKRIEITPVTAKGIHYDRVIKMKLPKNLRDPDQLMGRDLNGDGKAELILVKLGSGKTEVGVLEVSK